MGYNPDVGEVLGAGTRNPEPGQPEGTGAGRRWLAAHDIGGRAQGNRGLVSGLQAQDMEVTMLRVSHPSWCPRQVPQGFKQKGSKL